MLTEGAGSLIQDCSGHLGSGNSSLKGHLRIINGQKGDIAGLSAACIFDFLLIKVKFLFPCDIFSRT